MLVNIRIRVVMVCDINIVINCARLNLIVFKLYNFCKQLNNLS